MNIIKKTIFGKFPAREFIATRIDQGHIQEEVFLCSTNLSINITHDHAIICLEPVYVVLPVNTINFPEGEFYLEIRKGKIVAARLNVSLSQTIDCGGNLLAILKVDGADCFQLTTIRKFLILQYFNRNQSHSFRFKRIIAAIFSYPRKVIIVSYKEEGYFNMFPMDFYMNIQGTNFLILGLRNTNKTLEKISQTKKIAIASSGSVDKEIVYLLGKNHSDSSPLALEKIPLKFIETKLFKFPVPEKTSYSEVKVIGTENLGSHTMIMCEIEHTVQYEQGCGSLHHIHLFEFLNSNYDAN
jgi:flavin reductase (DIM6/NTAB) family NADH-FMN oxidoreductase RutF